MIKSYKIDTITFLKYAIKNHKIKSGRIKILKRISNKIITEYKNRNKLNINFICTHNSRRSQMAQVWSFFIIEYFALKNIYIFSGGTEITSFHRNTIKSLQSAGFKFNLIQFSHQNPKYLITFKNSKKSILGFSKTFDDQENTSPYIAIITCDKNNTNCPFIANAIDSFHLYFNDPKHSDNSDLMLNTYNEISSKIASEMFFVFNKVKQQIT